MKIVVGSKNNERLNILFITPWYPTVHNEIGGVFIQEYAKAMQRHAHVNVLHFQGAVPHLESSWHLQQVKSKQTSSGIPTYQLTYRRAMLPKISVLLRAWALIQSYKQITANGFLPDIIHAHVFQVALPVWILSKLFRAPLVISEHSSNFPRKTLSKSELIEVKLAYSNAAYVLPVSNYLQQAIEAYQVKANYQVIPNIVDTKLFSYRKRDWLESKQVIQFLFVGMMHDNKVKGIELLLNAFVLLNKSFTNWELILVGDGPAREKHEQFVQELGLVHKITFHGQQTKVEIAEQMKSTDAMVVPSLYETFSVVAAEALCCGTPVLSTRCGGPEGFITQKAGLLVARDDVMALCEGLIFMMSNLQTFDRQAIAHYASSLFSSDAVSRQLNQIYRKAVA